MPKNGATTESTEPVKPVIPALIDNIVTNETADETTMVQTNNADAALHQAESKRLAGDPHPTDEFTKEINMESGRGSPKETSVADANGKSETAKAVGEDADDNSEKSCLQKFFECFCKFYWKNEFLILILLVILLALAYPPLGAIYLAPQITATWIAVLFIFLLAGLGLKTEEFSKASQQFGFNFFIFVYNFGVDSAFVFGVSRLLSHYNVINQDLADGMVITASLPLTINMCVVLTKASGGDEAAAIVNTAMWNMVGVFLSPLLILGYIGQTGTVNRWVVFYKLAMRVVIPIVVGQLLKYFVPAVANFVKKYKPYFKKAQMYSLVFIVYTIFCRTFIDPDNQVPAKDVFVMIAFIGLSLVILMVAAWYLLALFFRKEIKLRVMGLYGCTHKTAAMGIPLINAIYEGSPALALYTLPLLIWHPMQLVIGTFLSPRLLAWVESFELDDDLALEVTDAEGKEVKDKITVEESKNVNSRPEIVDTEGLEIDAPSDELIVSAVSEELAV